MSKYLLPNGTVLIYLNGDPYETFGPCGVCGGHCCELTESGKCAGAYEGICHKEWEQAGIDIEQYAASGSAR